MKITDKRNSATAAGMARSENLNEKTTSILADFDKRLCEIWQAVAGGSSGQLTIGGQEMLLIADANSGILHHYYTLSGAGEDLLEEQGQFDFGRKWSVDAIGLAAKLHVAPLGTLAELFTDIKEAWEFHNDEKSLPFLLSRSYRFQALTKEELRLRGSCVFGAELVDGSLVLDRAPSHVPEENIDAVTRALRSVDPAGRTFIEQEVKFGGVVGKTACVRTDKSDEVVMARRPGRHGPTRFVKGREPEDCDTVFVVLKQVRQHRYLLVTGFVGQRPEPEPWDERSFSFSEDRGAAREQSRKFWANHALVYAPDVIVPGTEGPEV